MPQVSSKVTSLRVGIWLLTGEAVLLAGLVVFLLYQDLTARAETAGGAVAVTVYAAIITAIVALLAWSLARRRAWARGPAVVMQLLLIPLGWYALTGGLPALGVPVIIAGVVGALALMAPSTREALDA
jgi:hypothetical protein